MQKRLGSFRLLDRDQNDVSLACRYIEAGDSFDKLWYAELRSQKIAKLRKASLEKIFPSDPQVIDEICAFRDSGASYFSTAVHPSYMAGFMALFYDRGWFPEGEEWDFVNSFLHSRSLTFLIDACALPLSIEMMRIASIIKSEQPTLPIVNSEGFEFGADGAIAVLHGALLAMDGAASHHHRASKGQARVG